MSFCGNQRIRKLVFEMSGSSPYRGITRRPLSGGRRSKINPASFRARKRQEKKKRDRQIDQPREDLTVIEAKSEPVATAAASGDIASASAIASAPTTTRASIHQMLQKYVLPVRYRAQSDQTINNFYTREHAMAAAQRFPLWLLLAAFLSLDDTNPYSTTRITGPSMLPTCSPDGSEIYLKSAWHKTLWYKALQYVFPTYFMPSYAIGDLVGLSHPDHKDHVSCKRVVGVAGDQVQRYGQYVHLFQDQDPTGLGITWPSANDKVHGWIDASCAWDAGRDWTQQDPRRKFIVPEDTVWVEGDCPGLAIDSRQYGPVPLDWIQGRLIRRLWPFWRKEGELPLRSRPHPIPLDDETLQKYNVHRIMPPALPVADS